MEKVTEQQFDEIIESGETVLVDFYTEWCGPCNMIRPLLEDLSNKTPGIRFVKVDVSEEYLLGSRYKINHVPTMILIKNREEVGRTSSSNRLEEWIESHRG